MIVDLIKKHIQDSQIVEIADLKDIVIKPHTLYLNQTGTSSFNAGKQTTIRMLLFEKTKEENDTTYEKIKDTVGRVRNTIEGIVFYRLYWSSEEPQIALDSTWGREIELRIIHMEDE
jgi:hypothetical protein